MRASLFRSVRTVLALEGKRTVVVVVLIASAAPGLFPRIPHPTTSASAAGTIPSQPPTRNLGALPTCKDGAIAIRGVAWDRRHWNGGPISPLVDAGPHDAFGVRLSRRNGTLYDHPVAQAQYGLANVWSYAATGDERFLRRAEAQARRMVDRARTVDRALFFTYPFDFALHGEPNEVLRAPWYSGMAQGMGLALLVRLYEKTRDAWYLDASTKAFNSFLRFRPSGAPWFDEVDGSGYVWIQEYPSAHPDDTLNGHMFAALGLYDYYELTADPRAGRLFACAVTTVRRYAPAFRNPSWISSYCLKHHQLSAGYHAIHVSEMLKLFTYTGDASLARFADLFWSDYPAAISGTVHFSAGHYDAYTFTAIDRVKDRREVTLSRSSTAPADVRRRIRGQEGYWYHLTAGPFAGRWVRETPGRSFLAGGYSALEYAPTRTITLSPGTYLAVGFDEAGRPTARSSRTFGSPSTMRIDRSAFWNGAPYVHVVDGGFAGLWLDRAAISRFD
jgi:hypothetical protein